ncbi:MAG: cupin domain-containing protein [Thiolinea sp.]
MSDSFIRLMPTGDMQPSNLTPTEAFTSADKTELNRTFFAGSDDNPLVGVWECAPCKEVFDSYPVHEFISIISGSLTLTHADGRIEIFTEGDVFFIPKGTALTWEITETLRKYYMISN